MIFRTFFLLFTASVRSRLPGPPAVPGVFFLVFWCYTLLHCFFQITKYNLYQIVRIQICFTQVLTFFLPWLCCSWYIFLLQGYKIVIICTTDRNITNVATGKVFRVLILLPVLGKSYRDMITVFSLCCFFCSGLWFSFCL